MAADDATPRTGGGPFARWPRSADAALALAHLTFVTLLMEGPGDTMVARDLSTVPLWVVAVFVAASAALLVRRTRPLVVVGAGVASMLALLGSGYADTGGVAILGLYATGRYLDHDLLGEAAVAVTAGVFVLDGRVDGLPLGDVVAAIGFAIGAWLLGRGARLRSERAATLLREQEAERRRVVAEERTRIARELHDVVAHRVSIMTIQAGAAATVAERDPAAAKTAMHAVEEAGRQALDELRHLLGVLRPDVADAARDPQPQLVDLTRLVEQVRQAGPSVTLQADADLDRLPTAVQVSAYRIVQEALTNVVKHVGPRSSATVSLTRHDHALHVEVHNAASRNPDRATDVAAAGAGHGIIGMRERAHLLGGTLDAAPTDDGGFRVLAVLPVSAPILHDDIQPTEEPA